MEVNKNVTVIPARNLMGRKKKGEEKPKLRVAVRIPAHPDGKTGNIRTPFRQHPDSKPALSGHLVE